MTQLTDRRALSAQNAKFLTVDRLCYELREIANVLRMRDCPDSAAQCEEAAYRLENPHD